MNPQCAANRLTAGSKTRGTSTFRPALARSISVGVAGQSIFEGIEPGRFNPLRRSQSSFIRSVIAEGDST